jgi:phosphatidate phosphatase APP1
MRSINAFIVSFIHNLEMIFDRIKYRIKIHNPIRIYPYRGFGSHQYIYVKGRVLEEKKIFAPKVFNNLWINLLNSLNRIESDEVPYARLRMQVSKQSIELLADEEGYFQSHLKVAEFLPADDNCRSVTFELLEPIRPGHPAVNAVGEVYIPFPNCKFGIISDIDDTVIKSFIKQPFQLLWTQLFSSARTRQPVPGMAAFYRGLAESMSNSWDEAENLRWEKENPIFYLSTSPWNLYPLLEDYLNYQKFPPHPILYLRDWGISSNEILPFDNQNHKLGFINFLMDFYPQMDFILVGDSGQQDPEIYTQVAIQHVERILAIYILEVEQNSERADTIHRMRSRLSRMGVPMIFARTVIPLAEHAASNGWITAEALEIVRQSM